MIKYEEKVIKSVKKGKVPKDVFKTFHNVFMALETSGDMNMFDIKQLKTSEKRAYYRLRKGKYRAIFYVEDGDYAVISLAKREEVYRSWE